MTQKEYNILLNRIEKRQNEIEEEIKAIKFFKKEIAKNDRLNELKSDCERIIKSVNKIKSLQNGLIKLYRQQNEYLREQGSRATNIYSIGGKDENKTSTQGFI